MQAVIFDLDGVLIDSEPLWERVRRDLAARHGLAWPADATAAMQGVSTATWSAYLAEVVGIPGSPASIAELVIEEMARRYDDELPLLPGAVDAVRRLGERWPVGLASGSPGRLVEAVLGSAAFTGLVTAAASTDEVASGKPAPDVYLEVARRLGADPSACVALEDSSAGMRSAHAAGLRLIAIPQPGFPQQPEALALADVRLVSLSEVGVALVERLLVGR